MDSQSIQIDGNDSHSNIMHSLSINKHTLTLPMWVTQNSASKYLNVQQTSQVEIENIYKIFSLEILNRMLNNFLKILKRYFEFSGITMIVEIFRSSY